MAIVTNEDGTYIGAVTLEDMLEEIVGEIEDEWDIDTVDSPIRRTDSGWSVSGRVLLADLESEIGFAADRTPRVSTLAGFIMNRMGRMPKAGDQFVDNDFAFRVTEVDGRRVITVGINPVTSIGEMVPENGNG
jgi:CBS domain containing-hemolysin-like protein